MEASGAKGLRTEEGVDGEARVSALLGESAPAAPASGSKAVTEVGQAARTEERKEVLGTASYVAAIDQGTTSTRFIVYDSAAKVVASHQLEFTQIYPRAGYVLFLALTLFVLLL